MEQESQMETNLLAQLIETEAAYRIVMPDCRHIAHTRDRLEMSVDTLLTYLVSRARTLYHDSMEYLKSLGLHQVMEAIEREADFKHCSTTLIFREKTCDVVPCIKSAFVYRIWRHLESVPNFPRLEAVTGVNTWLVDLLSSVVRTAGELQNAYKLEDPSSSELLEFITKCMLRVAPELERDIDSSKGLTATVQDLGWCPSAHVVVAWVETYRSMNISRHADHIHRIAVPDPDMTFVVPYASRTGEDDGCFKQLQERNLFPSNWIGIPIYEKGVNAL
jgi:hypothetical protein